jgi:hypothetical protein
MAVTVSDASPTDCLVGIYQPRKFECMPNVESHDPSNATTIAVRIRIAIIASPAPPELRPFIFGFRQLFKIRFRQHERAAHDEEHEGNCGNRTLQLTLTHGCPLERTALMSRIAKAASASLQVGPHPMEVA